MLAGEIQVIKDVVDKELPALVAAEITRLPLAYQPLAQVLVNSLLPMASVYLDSKIAAIAVSGAATA